VDFDAIYRMVSFPMTLTDTSRSRYYLATNKSKSVYFLMPVQHEVIYTSSVERFRFDWYRYTVEQPLSWLQWHAVEYLRNGTR